MAGVPRDIGALKSLVLSGFKPQLPAWQTSTLSIALCPLGSSPISISRALLMKPSLGTKDIRRSKISAQLGSFHVQCSPNFDERKKIGDPGKEPRPPRPRKPVAHNGLGG